MENEIISYMEMCQREGASLQRGMNFGIGNTHSVVLMSVRPNAPYRDRVEDDGMTLIYEGHDEPKSPEILDPKLIDQPEFTDAGTPTQNGRFARAAHEYVAGRRSPERVRVYEKIKKGIWSYNGLFHLVDSWTERDTNREVFKFKLISVEDNDATTDDRSGELEHRRIIPSWVKVEVFKRDKGRCVLCGSGDNLHFDHDLPFAKGGTSLTPANVQLLCMRHNLEKSDQLI